jgi:hypothetical protein
VSEAKLSIIGAGIDGFEQLTEQARTEISQARIVYYSSFNVQQPPAPVPGVAWKNLDFGRYRKGELRPAMYEAMAEQVVMGAVTYGRAALLQPGSATILDAITSNCCTLARNVGVCVRIIPGVSSCETVIAQLQADTMAGLQIVVALSALLHKTKLNPEMTTVILQPAYYDTLRWVGVNRCDVDYGLLSLYLQGQLGSSRQAFIIRSTCLAGPASIVPLLLSDITQYASEISPYHSIVVPAEAPSVRDPEFDQWIRRDLHI